MNCISEGRRSPNIALKLAIAAYTFQSHRRQSPQVNIETPKPSLVYQKKQFKFKYFFILYNMCESINQYPGFQLIRIFQKL